MPDVERPQRSHILGVPETRGQPLSIVGRQRHQDVELLIQVGSPDGARKQQQSRKHEKERKHEEFSCYSAAIGK